MICQNQIHAGHYSLSDGLLVSGQTTVYAGTMEQSGGTNRTRELVVAAGGYYTLNGGQLITSNSTVGTVDCLGNIFVHNGGSHTVQNRFALNDGVVYSNLGNGVLRIGYRAFSDCDKLSAITLPA